MPGVPDEPIGLRLPHLARPELGMVHPLPDQEPRAVSVHGLRIHHLLRVARRRDREAHAADAELLAHVLVEDEVRLVQGLHASLAPGEVHAQRALGHLVVVYLRVSEEVGAHPQDLLRQHRDADRMAVRVQRPALELPDELPLPPLGNILLAAAGKRQALLHLRGEVAHVVGGEVVGVRVPGVARPQSQEFLLCRNLPLCLGGADLHGLDARKAIDSYARNSTGVLAYGPPSPLNWPRGRREDAQAAQAGQGGRRRRRRHGGQAPT
mmetsp:Transcript_46228/g.138182  ORF Transcript_46228/g.138182 Transcript_46228/m.138182 type:complete len:266 (+) Transcript_46228:232-1029(+)